MEVRGVRIQGVWSPPVAGLTACRAHLIAAGAVKLGQATASESVCGSKWGHEPGDAWILGYFSDTSLALYSGYAYLHLLVSSIRILYADT